MATEAQIIKGMIGDIIPPSVDVAAEYRGVTAALANPAGLTAGAINELRMYQNQLSDMLSKGQTQYTVGGNNSPLASAVGNNSGTVQGASKSLLEKFKDNLWGDNKQIAGQPSTGNNQFGPAQTDLSISDKIQGAIGNVGFVVLGIGLVIFAAVGPAVYKKLK